MRVDLASAMMAMTVAHAPLDQGVHLSVPLAQSRAATRTDDWVQLVPVHGQEGVPRNCDRPIVVRQTLSLDAGFVYQQVCRWVTSDDIIQVRISDGSRREIMGGNSLAVIRTGPWRGYLLIERHLRPDNDTPADATWVIRPDGTEMFYVPGSQDGNRNAVKRWLAGHSWYAD